MLTTLRMFLGEELMFATVNGSNTYTQSACFALRFGLSKKSVQCAPYCVTVRV